MATEEEKDSFAENFSRLSYREQIAWADKRLQGAIAKDDGVGLLELATHMFEPPNSMSALKHA